MRARLALMPKVAERIAPAQPIDEGAWILGPAAPIGGEAQRPDTRPPLAVLYDDRVVAQMHLCTAAHPLGLSGATARIALCTVQGDWEGWLLPALAEIGRHAQHGYGLSTLLAEPERDDPAITSALVRAGYRALEGSKLYRRELVAEFWRERDVFIIAEAGSNWRMGTPARDLAMARALIEVAADAGADAVKFQSFRPETLYVANAGSSGYLANSGITATMEEIFADLTMPHDMLPVLAEHARTAGIGFMSTAFSPADFAAVDPLVAAHKIASYEISHIRLIELAARAGKPTVMSTGAATLQDVAWAVEHYHRCGGRDLCLMQCTAKYPAPIESLNLAAIPELAGTFGVSVGLSDHSRDPVVGPLAAAALGARVIEKHFTLDNRLPGPDHAFAVTPAELRQLVKAVRATASARGTGVKDVLPVETELSSFAQRGVQAIRPIAAGDVLTEDGNIAILRPGQQTKGVHPRYLQSIHGRRATRTLRPGEGLQVGDWSEG
jgi:N-acetylneuraminate synthase